MSMNSAYTKQSVPLNETPQLADEYTADELAAIIEARVNFPDQLHKYDRALLASAAHLIRTLTKKEQ